MKWDLCWNAKVRLVIFSTLFSFFLCPLRRCSALTCFSLLVSAFHLVSQTTFPMTPSLATSPSMAFSPYLNHMGPGMGLMPELLPSTPLLVPGSPTGVAAMANGTSSHKHSRTDKLEVKEPVCRCCVRPQRDDKQTLNKNCREVFVFRFVVLLYLRKLYPASSCSHVHEGQLRTQKLSVGVWANWIFFSFLWPCVEPCDGDAPTDPLNHEYIGNWAFKIYG